MSVTLDVLDEDGRHPDGWDDGLACRPYYGLYMGYGTLADLDETIEDARCTLRLTDVAGARAAVEADTSLPNRDMHLRMLDVVGREPGRWRLRFCF